MTIATLLASVIIVTLPAGFTIPGYGVKCGENIGAIYNKVTEEIYVCAVDSSTEFYKYHELGHHFWFKYMTQAQRDEYTKEFNKSKVFHRDWGKTNSEEEFADNFAIHVLKIRHNKALNKRILLIRKYLKNTK